MKYRKVGTVMVTDVVKAAYGTRIEEAARLLGENRVSGLPVVDDDEKVIGVVSASDLAAHRSSAAPGGWTVGALMSAPAITVHADATIAEAARTMAAHRMERLPVLDEEDRLVGMVTRRDLLQIFLRPDEDIRRDVVETVIVGALRLAPPAVTVIVREGVVILAGRVEQLSEKSIVLGMTGQVDGVVGVVDRVTYRVDDSHPRPAARYPRSTGEGLPYTP
ncbi:CBS domain-containing protein [Streptomyces sp. NPDC058001]|uniref:CBS domain-containing protein n=1 Tax=Streptomyces sp. NPDC058001 TaxID=3346300 RepID=UPI0036F0AD69